MPKNTPDDVSLIRIFYNSTISQNSDSLRKRKGSKVRPLLKIDVQRNNLSILIIRIEIGVYTWKVMGRSFLTTRRLNGVWFRGNLG